MFCGYYLICFQEKRREEEEKEAKLRMQLAQEAAHAKIARGLHNEVIAKVLVS